VTTGPALSHRQILVVMGGLMTGMLLAALDQTIVSTALPTIAGELHGLSHISYIITAYLLTSTVGTPLFGKISDLYGRKRIFQAAIVVFLIGSALSGVAQSFSQLILFRAIQGFGAGGLIAMTQTIIGDIVSPRERGRYQGYIGSVFALASVAGPLLGGFFVDSLSWRYIFYINIPLGLVALAVTTRALNLPFQRRQAKVDYWGAALLVGGVGALLLVGELGGMRYAWLACSSGTSEGPPSRSSRRTCSATACFACRRPRASSSVRPCSARSLSYRFTYRSPRAPALRNPGFCCYR